MFKDHEQLKPTALKIRKKLLDMHYKAKSGHVGSSLSSVDLLTYIYGVWWKNSDEFILSKGHGAAALYATLAQYDLLTETEIESYYQDGTKFPGHPAPLAHPLIPLATGSLGHGFPVAAGIAFANLYLKPTSKKITCLLSDGECNEGSVWEAALFAAHHKLVNLTIVVDVNGIQGFGKTNDVLDLRPFSKKWEAFGFTTVEIDGHDFDQIDAAFGTVRNNKPLCVLANTVKGKGVPFMENTVDWHYLSMNENEYMEAKVHLNKADR